jgi:hypothetical protein
MAGEPSTKRSTIAIVLLSVALVVSNGWWFFQALDSGISATYREATLEEQRAALVQAFAAFPVVARANSTRADVLAAAGGAIGDKEFFEKDGFVWVGRLGFSFDASGRVVQVMPAWEPFAK